MRPVIHIQSNPSMPFQPGVSGNPGGRKREKPFYRALCMEVAAEGDNHQALRRIARAMLMRAGNGDVAAATFVADRLDGKVPQPVGGSDELGPARLHVTWSGMREVMQAEAAKVIEAMPEDAPRVSSSRSAKVPEPQDS